jgi:hypothetical protein
MVAAMIPEVLQFGVITFTSRAPILAPGRDGHRCGELRAARSDLNVSHGEGGATCLSSTPFEATRFKNLIHRNPVHAGRFHGNRVNSAPCERIQVAAQRFRLCQLAEQHRYKLPPTAESSRVALALMLLYCCLKSVSRNQLQDLAEDAAYSFQGEVSSVDWICSCTN